MLFKAIRAVSEKSKITVAAFIGNLCILIHLHTNWKHFKVFLKQIKGVFSAMFAVSHPLNFPHFSLFQDRRVYA